MRIAASFATVFVMGTLQGCTCSHSEPYNLGKVDAPVKVKLVENIHTGTKTRGLDIDLRLQSFTNHELQIASTPPMSVPVYCFPVNNLDVSVAKSFDRVAYRCEPGTNWNIVWIGATEKFFGESKDLGISPATTPDHWMDANAVPKLAAIAHLLLTRGSPKAMAMLDEISQVDGDQAVFETLQKSTAMPLRVGTHDTNIKDPWIIRRNKLPDEKKTQLDHALRSAVELPKPGADALFRAIHVLDPSDPALPEIWAARLREIDEALPKVRPAIQGFVNFTWEDRIWHELLHQLVRTRPAIAGEIACRDLELRKLPSVESLIAVAKGQTPCPVLSRMLENMAADPACNIYFSCNDSAKHPQRCTLDELDTRIETFVNAPYNLGGDALMRDVAAIAAGKARGLISKDFALRLERASYTIDMPSTPQCPSAPPGSPCSCFDLREHPVPSICRTKADTTNGELRYCSYKIDDKKKLITNVVARKAD